MKKNVFLLVMMVAFCMNSNAQLGRGALKGVGKSVAKAAESMGADIAATQVTNKVVAWMDEQNTISAEDSEYTTRLNAIVSGKLVDADGKVLNYKVYENAEINILACSNGAIRVYSGLLDAFSDEEVAALIAIQIGHIANNDTHDALLKVISADNAQNAAGKQLEKVLSFSGEQMGTIVNELLQVPYSDKENKEADKYAAKLLTTAGYGTNGLVSALRKLAEMEANDKAAEEDSNIELSAASKFVTVGSNNALRASLIQ